MKLHVNQNVFDLTVSLFPASESVLAENDAVTPYQYFSIKLNLVEVNWTERLEINDIYHTTELPLE